MARKFQFLHRFLFYVGRRGAIIFFYGIVSLIIGLGNVGDKPSARALANASIIDHILPLQIWYGIWTMTGLLCIVSVAWHYLRLAAISVFSFMASLFAIGYFAAEILVPDARRAWVAGILYAGFAMIMLIIAGWPEPPGRFKKD